MMVSINIMFQTRSWGTSILQLAKTRQNLGTMLDSLSSITDSCPAVAPDCIWSSFNRRGTHRAHSLVTERSERILWTDNFPISRCTVKLQCSRNYDVHHLIFLSLFVDLPRDSSTDSPLQLPLNLLCQVYTKVRNTCLCRYIVSISL